MPTTYEYTPEDVKLQPLAEDVNAAFPGNYISANIFAKPVPRRLYIDFNVALTGPEEATLDAIVIANKAAPEVEKIMVCWTMALATQADQIVPLGAGWKTLQRMQLKPDIYCSSLERFVLRFRFRYRSAGGPVELRVTENNVPYGAVDVLPDVAGWQERAFRAGGTPVAGANMYALQGDPDVATQFELRGLIVEVCVKN
jgi:hypothetical protein